MKDVVLAGFAQAVSLEDKNMNISTWVRAYSDLIGPKTSTGESANGYIIPSTNCRNGEEFLYCRARPPW